MAHQINIPNIPEVKGLVSAKVGSTFSFADSETKKENGTNHKQRVKYDKT